MNCRRCHGLMVQERFEDLRGDPHDISFYGWRCVCCGNITDPVIAANRSKPVATAAMTVPADAARQWGFGSKAA